MKNSIVLIIILLSLVACNDSNPTNPDLDSSSSQNQAIDSSSSSSQISSSIQAISSSVNTSSSSLISSSSSSIQIITTTKILSKAEVLEKFKMYDDDIAIAEKWYAKWDSVIQIDSNLLSNMHPYNEIIDSSIAEIYDIELTAWCEIEGDSFKFVQTGTEPIIDSSTYGTLYNMQGEEIFYKGTYRSGTDLFLGLPSIHDIITCTRKNSWISLNNICNDDIFEITVNWKNPYDQSNSLTPEKFITSILRADTYYAPTHSYYYNRSNNGACIL